MHTHEQLEQQNKQLFQQWLGKQGLWRQLRYGLPWSFGVEGYGRRLGLFVLRLVLLLAVVLLVGFKLRDSMLSTRQSQKQFKQQLAKNLNAAELEMDDYAVGLFERKLVLNKLQSSGNSSAFYEVLNIEQLVLPFDYLDFKLGDLSREQTLAIDKLDLFVKSGEVDDKQAAQAYAALFNGYDQLPQSFELKKLNLFWGEIFDGRGMLVNCKASINKHLQGWQIRLQGGELSFGPLHFMPLQSALITLTPDKLLIEELLLGNQQRGQIKLHGSIGSGATPELQLQYTFSGIDWEEFLKLHNAKFISGKMQGQGELQGSFNSQEGVLLSCKAELDEQNQLTIGDELKLIEIFNRWDSAFFDSSWRFAAGTVELQRRYGSYPSKKILLNNLANAQLALSGELNLENLAAGNQKRALDPSGVSSFVMERAAKEIEEKYDQRYAYWMRVEPLLKSNKSRSGSLANQRQQQIWSELAWLDESCSGYLRIALPREYADKLAKLPQFAEVHGQSLLLQLNYSGKLRKFAQSQGEELLYLSSQLAHEKLSDDK